MSVPINERVCPPMEIRADRNCWTYEEVRMLAKTTMMIREAHQTTRREIVKVMRRSRREGRRGHLMLQRPAVVLLLSPLLLGLALLGITVRGEQGGDPPRPRFFGRGQPPPTTKNTDNDTNNDSDNNNYGARLGVAPTARTSGGPTSTFTGGPRRPSGPPIASLLDEEIASLGDSGGERGYDEDDYRASGPLPSSAVASSGRAYSSPPSSATTSAPPKYFDGYPSEDGYDDLHVRDDALAFESPTTSPATSTPTSSVFLGDDTGEDRADAAGKEALYEAYNQLHVLAQVRATRKIRIASQIDSRIDTVCQRDIHHPFCFSCRRSTTNPLTHPRWWW